MLPIAWPQNQAARDSGCVHGSAWILAPTWRIPKYVTKWRSTRRRMGWQRGNEDYGTLVNPELRASFAGSFFKPLPLVMNGFINQARLEPVIFSPIDHSWAPQFCIGHLWGWHPDTHLWRECINSKANRVQHMVMIRCKRNCFCKVLH